MHKNILLFFKISQWHLIKHIGQQHSLYIHSNKLNICDTFLQYMTLKSTKNSSIWTQIHPEHV